MKILLAFLFLTLITSPAYSQSIDTIRQYWPNHQIQSEEYNTDGKGWGYIISWYENGKKAYSFTLKDGHKYSYNIEWDEEGKLKEEDIITGYDVVDDVNTNTGVVVRKIGYLSGKFITYKSGVKLSEGHKIMGKKESKWSYYNSQGHIVRDEWYENGRLVATDYH